VTGPTPREVAAAKAVLAADRKARKKPIPRLARTTPTAAGQREPRQIDKAYKGWISRLFCIATKIRTGGEAYGVQVCHVRYSCAAAGWRNPGLQRKPHDWQTLPLLPAEHARQHSGNELNYYHELHLNPPDICADLRAAFPDLEAGKAVLRRYAKLARQAA
jgi:hypothetical protein